MTRGEFLAEEERLTQVALDREKDSADVDWAHMPVADENRFVLSSPAFVAFMGLLDGPVVPMPKLEALFASSDRFQ